MALSEQDLEAIAVKHEAFGFGQVEPDGLTVHGFDPDGLRAFIAEVRRDDEELIRQLVNHIERNTCTHENTHRGGVIWEICDGCGAKWADDEGGKPEFKWPKAVLAARARLEKAP